MAIKLELKNDKIYIEMDIDPPVPSKSGKTLVLATTRGNIMTDETFGGSPVILGLNAYVYV